MSSVVISGDTSGSITLAAPAVAGTNTATLPAATGTVMVSGNQPAFSYSCTNTQSISANTETLIQFTSKNFDTANAFNTGTYLFVAPVAGYYQFNMAVVFGAPLTANEFYFYVTKNNGGTGVVPVDVFGYSGGIYALSASVLLSAAANDTFGVKVYQNNGTKTLSSGTTFSGSLVRTT